MTERDVQTQLYKEKKMNYKVWTKEDIIEVLNKASRKADYPCNIPVTISKTLTVTGGYFQAIFEKDTWGNIKYIKADKFTFSYYYLNCAEGF